MTDLDTGPSSIRDDSICESSLPPNKSSGDIGELKPCPFCGCAAPSLNPPVKDIGFTGSINCPGCMASMPREIDDAELIRSWNTRTPDPESAAEIERLRREVEEANTAIAQLDQRCALFERSTITAESAVAAAWEKAEKHAVAALGQHGSMLFIQEHGWAGLMEVVASAIRAAVGKGD